MPIAIVSPCHASVTGPRWSSGSKLIVMTDRLVMGVLYDGSVVGSSRMARGRQREVLGPLEAEVMEVVWASDGPVSVRAMLERLNKGRRQPLAYTTVMTV